MRRARPARLIAAIAKTVALVTTTALAASACSLLTSLDGLSTSPLAGMPDDDAHAELGADGAVDGSSDASAAGDTRAASDALDAGDDAGGPNLEPESTFERGTCDPWIGFQGSAMTSSVAHSGAGACRVCTSASTTDFFTADDNRSPGAGVVGATYRAEAWVRADPMSPAPAGITLFLRNATFMGSTFVTLESNMTATTPPDATWQRLTVTLTLTKTGDLNVFLGADAAAGACFLLDDVTLRRID